MIVKKTVKKVMQAAKKAGYSKAPVFAVAPMIDWTDRLINNKYKQDDLASVVYQVPKF